MGTGIDGEREMIWEFGSGSLCRVHTCFNGGLQLTQAGGDLGVHLALARRVVWEGIAVCAERLADLHIMTVRHTLDFLTQDLLTHLSQAKPQVCGSTATHGYRIFCAVANDV